MIYEVIQKLRMLFIRWCTRLLPLPRWATTTAVCAFIIVCSLAFWRSFKHLVLSHDRSVWVDVILGTALLAVIPFILAAYGGHMAAETIDDPRRRRNVKLKFWGLCAVGVVLAFLQQYRSITEDAKNQQKNETAQTHIISMLTDLHDSGGSMTEAERRKKILDALREKYILSHDVDQSMIDRTEAPPFDWVNAQLKELGENWSVVQQPTTLASIPVRTRTYLTIEDSLKFTGKNPNNAEGSNFQVGDPMAFNLHYHAIGPNALYLDGAAYMVVLEPDVSPRSLEDAYQVFVKQTSANWKNPLNHPQKDWMLFTPDMHAFNTAFAWDGPMDNRTMHPVTQADLDNLKSGTLIAVVIAVFNYKDASQLHQFWLCAFLQPPAQPPGIWHSFKPCPVSN